LRVTIQWKGRILERLLLRFLPWWLFAIIALAFLPATLAVGREFLANWQMLSAAQATLPQGAVPIGAFDPARHVSAVGEVRLTGIWLRDLGVGTIVKEGADDAYIVIKDANGPDYAVLFFRDFEKASVAAGLAALDKANGQITIAGFHETDIADADAVTADLMARNLAAGPPMLLLEPYFGDRTAAFGSRRRLEALTFGIIAGINLIVLLVAVVKARAWRARVAARRPATNIPRVARAAATAAAPASAAPAQFRPAKGAAKPGDPFASGPIQSPKGWFR
jgi:hypothetical protein